MAPYEPLTVRSYRSDSWVVTLTVATIVIAISLIVLFALSTPLSTGPQVLPVVAHPYYPVGVPDAHSPSFKSPPGSNALKGYVLRYVNDFNGGSLPHNWDVFTGVPGGDPGGQFASTHVTVSGGLLRLNTWRDPKFHNRWVTGGVCQCGLAYTYGAFFVRSRITGSGPNEVQLLWPQSNNWPPEIDFNETGASSSSTSSTVHFGAVNHIDQRSLSIDMTKWHTWGIVWTPTSMKFIVNGQVWGAINIPAESPNVPMTLDLEQRAMCQIGIQCPSKPVSMLVDWVAEYTRK